MYRKPAAPKARLSADLWEVKVFVLSVPTVGNDPSGQCMCVEVSGTNDDGWRLSYHCRGSKYSMVHTSAHNLTNKVVSKSHD